jgi:hypothetical protein
VKRLPWLTLLLAAAAGAFVMPAWSILKHLAEERDKLQVFLLRVDGSATFGHPALKDAAATFGLPADRTELQVDGTFYLKLPGRCRVELSSAEGGKQIAEVNAHGKQRVEGTELASVTVALQETCALLAERSSSDAEAHAVYERHLKSLGVKLESTSLGRFGGQVAYVLGEPGDDKPQAWIYKDSFFPARVRFADAQGVAWDVRMLDYTSPATGDWFPRTLEVYQGGELAFRFTGLKADAHGAIPEKLF